MSRSVLSFGWLTAPVPSLPEALVDVSGADVARVLVSVMTVVMSAAEPRVGVILNESPAATVPELILRLKPSMTGSAAGGVANAKLPMSVLSDRRRTL
ncbi:hypothetical protein D3C87_1501070 [compost metagenome]